jgi:hypothetical protein
MKDVVKGLAGQTASRLIAAALGAAGMYFGGLWINSDLEYWASTKDKYLSTALGEQGLTMNYQGQSLNNVSVVEFAIANRTSKQFSDVELIFTIDEKDAPALISSGITPPKGLSQKETVRLIPSEDSHARVFHLNTVPAQRDSEYFYAVFVFEGDKAPPMYITSKGNTAIIPKRVLKDGTISVAIVVLTATVSLVIFLLISGLTNYILAPHHYRGRIKDFKNHLEAMKKSGDIPDTEDPKYLNVAENIYSSLVRPKPDLIWGKIFPPRKFDL